MHTFRNYSLRKPRAFKTDQLLPYSLLSLSMVLTRPTTLGIAAKTTCNVGQFI